MNVNWGGVVWASSNLLAGDDAEDSDIRAGALHGETRINASASTNTNIGTFGMFAQITGGLGQPRIPNTATWTAGSNMPRLWGNVWYRGLEDMLWLGMGTWLFALDDLGRLGLTRLGTGLVSRELHHRQGSIVPQNPFMTELVMDGFGVDFTPVSNVRVGVGVPWNWNNVTPGTQASTVGANAIAAQDIYRGAVARVRVDLDGIGFVGVGFSGATNWTSRGGPRVTGRGDTTDIGDFYGYFRLTMVDNLVADLGIRFGAAEDGEDLSIGIGAQYSFGEFGVNFRSTAAFGIGEYWDTSLNATQISAEVLPWFDVSQNVMLAMNLGFGVNLAGSELSEADPLLMWMAHPYVTVNIGNPRLAFGFRISGNNNRGNDRTASQHGMQWEIPIGFQFAF
jgi:hypothetical protein